ncbi:conserved protein, unknown function [Plasmodium sp. gorilla clade G2]|uniref:conserved protein, unknown function n=1 Tax=Plasmodium sp. gorilla clade G2 TaxID=880535 RepID=UPI000D22B2BE|nr:conserved protein, unknown function [Plasmodium sp. gorilla clade G2]SOV16436.1 conserved protein, unknown function [Plasmodium sp. gorilla clade G2]
MGSSSSSSDVFILQNLEDIKKKGSKKIKENKKISKRVKRRSYSNSSSKDSELTSYSSKEEDDYKEEKKIKIKMSDSVCGTPMKEAFGELDVEGENNCNEINDARKYFKEGQKIITPPNGDGTRAFYESLLEENPNSIIAIKYCIEHGILSGTKHHEALYKYYVLKKNNAFKSNFGGVRIEFKKLLEESYKDNKSSYEELIKKEILSK